MSYAFSLIDLYAVTLSGLTVLIIIALMPRTAWRLLKAKLGKGGVCLITNDAGAAKIDRCLVGPNWVEYDRVKYPIARLVDSAGNEAATRRYVLMDVKKPFWIIYEPKGVALNPDHLRHAVKGKLADDNDKRLFLDPKDVKDELKLMIHKSNLAYIMRNAEAAAFEEARALPVKTIMLLLSALVIGSIAISIVWIVVTGGHNPLALSQAQQAVHTVHNVTRTVTQTVTSRPPPQTVIPT